MADVFIQVDADAQQGMQALLSIARAQEKVVDGGKKMNSAMQNVEKQTKQTGNIGKGAINGIQGALGQLVGATSIAATAFKMFNMVFDEMNKRAEKGSKLMEKMAGQAGKIVQATGGDPQKSLQIRNQAQLMAGSIGIDQGKAVDLLVTSARLGMGDKAGFFARGHNVLSDPAQAMQLVANLRQSMPGSSVEGLTNKLMSAQQMSGKLDFNQFSESLLGIMPVSKQVGFGGTETMAALSLAVKKFKGDSGAEALKGLFESIQKYDTEDQKVAFGQKASSKIAGASIFQTLKNIQGLSSEDRKKMFGEKLNSAALADYLLANQGEYKTGIGQLNDEERKSVQSRGSYSVSLKTGQATYNANDSNTIYGRMISSALQMPEVSAENKKNAIAAQLANESRNSAFGATEKQRAEQYVDEKLKNMVMGGENPAFVAWKDAAMRKAIEGGADVNTLRELEGKKTYSEIKGAKAGDKKYGDAALQSSWVDFGAAFGKSAAEEFKRQLQTSQSPNAHTE